MNKEILKHYYEEGKKFGYALARGATDLPSVQTFDELYTEQFNKHGVMQGCQCKDRIGETKVWCCNQCGLPCEDFWLPTHYTVGSRAVGNSAAGKGVCDGHDEMHVTIRDGDFDYCMACNKQVPRA